jgi:peptide deformylase
MRKNSSHLQFIDFNDPILDSPARPLSPVEIKSPEMQKLFDALLSFAKGEQGDLQKHVLVGLAAPQVGIGLQVILVDTEANGKGKVAHLRLYINPKITAFSQETESWYEGCYSTGNVKGVVERPSQVTVEALDREGNKIIETHQGYVARIFQHEIDHLNGVRFPDRMGDHQLLHIVKAEEMPLYRNGEGWRTWKHSIPKAHWKNQM